MNKLRRILRLTASEGFLLVSAFVLASLVKLALRLLPFRTVLRVLDRLAPQPGVATAPDPALARRIAWAVAAAARRVPGRATCLPQALTARALLNHLRQPSELRIGVTRDGQGPLEAHAWIEYDSQVLVGRLRNLEQFQPLPLPKNLTDQKVLGRNIL